MTFDGHQDLKWLFSRKNPPRGSLFNNKVINTRKIAFFIDGKVVTTLQYW